FVAGKGNCHRRTVDGPLVGRRSQQCQDREIYSAINNSAELRRFLAAAAQMRIGSSELQDAGDNDGENGRCPQRSNDGDPTLSLGCQPVTSAARPPEWSGSCFPSTRG